MKSLTNKICSSACLYLKERGFKPIETEVSIENSWVADIASVCIPTRTEVAKIGLMEYKPRFETPFRFDTNKYNLYKAKLQNWIYRFNCLPEIITAVVEVKISRSDFFNDTKWDRTSPTNLRYLACPKGLLKPDEYPNEWTILECSKESGKVLKRVQKRPILSVVPLEKQIWVVYNIGVRQYNRLEYKWIRDTNKLYKKQRDENTTLMRINTAIELVLDIVERREDIDKALSYGRIKRIPRYLRRRLEKIADKGTKMK